ncbi:hypothetical protein Pla123a_31070 [Posidoniimonas polymericola]|uniref:Type VI secretion system component TssM1 N-terminal domain-containing protein n=1 Tax=Posidoniimonas polymericola TaxID=2528002 RepID=A0A5C5YL70_9BACT|nr:type VI secretion protein IcmF/TssM N-terminal domain-containing protein [Posidoniimonas polymericola]TWT75597.1 hypothetical protein Pla123a_31070 [Posidoniimonas polymericola]
MFAKIRKAAPALGKIAVAPFVGFARGAVAGGRTTWTLHFALLGSVLAGLWRLNNYLELDKVVRAPSQLLREFWLPLLFLLAYAIAWSAVAAYRAATRPGAESPFPEIDRCWQRALAAMRRHGLDLADRPTLLLIGEPAGREAELLSAFALTPTLGPVPSQADAELRILADDQAIYVLCHGPSLLSRAAERLAHQRMQNRHATAAFAHTTPAEDRIPAALRVEALAHAGTTNRPAAAAEQLLVDDSEFLSLAEQTDLYPADAWPTEPLFSADEAAACAAQLDYVVSLLRRERDGLRALDGIAVLTPADAGASDAAAADARTAMEQDLDVIGEAAGVRCPVLAVVTDLQHAPGCGRLLHLLNADRKGRRLGVAIPAAAATDAATQVEQLRELTGPMASALCQRLMQVEADNNAEVLRDNAALFELESCLAARGGRLATIVSGAVAGADGAPWPLEGCYLTATGDQLAGSQAFGAGVLQRLVEPATPASWTPEALERDAQQTRFAQLGYAGLAVACSVVGLLLLL